MYDIIVFGATGFTGALVAEYLAKRINYQQNTKSNSDPRLQTVTWAIAGRNLKRLEEVKNSAISINADCYDVGIIQADSSDQSSIDAMVKQAKVILSVAGPFYRYSLPVVDACVRFGVHYCDITGETHYIRKLAETYHEQAKNKGVFIVTSCGFDSIPSDLGVFMMINHIKKNLNEECSEIATYYTKFSGGVSGGTLLTMMESFDRFGAKKSSTTPRNSNAAPTKHRGHLDFMGFGYDRTVNLYSYPFVMSNVNATVIRRSNEVMNYYYGKDFIYKEGSASKSLFGALFTTVLIALFILAAMIKPFRYLIKRFGIQPGQGPSKEARENGSFGSILVAKTSSGKQVIGKVHGNGDPGYKATSVMVSESALCILLELDPKKKQNLGGVLTPASAMGQNLIDRLCSCDNGFLFKVEK